MSALHRMLRRFTLICCLFPASFACYSSIGKWFSAIFKGKKFFIDIVEQADDLIIQLKVRSLAWRLFVEYPLRFARQIIWKDSVGDAFRHCFSQRQKQSITAVTPYIVLKESSSIELIPGLLDEQEESLRQADKYLQDFSSFNTVSVIGQGHIVLGGTCNFSGTITVIVAHWDPEGIVDPYVQHMCHQFKSLGWCVVLASAAPLQGKWTEAPDWADAIVYRTCQGYDFTSWKTALAYFPSLYLCDELILCNDSVFGGIGSYGTMHEQMSPVVCDFWGITESHEQCPHLQSFYLVFRRKALGHSAFKDFFDRVPLSDSRKKAIICETSLSIWLAKYGLRPAAFSPFNEELPPSTNPSCEEWQKLLQSGVPLLKRELLQKNERNIHLNGWGDILFAKGYPLQLIFNYFERRKINISNTHCYNNPNKTWPPNVHALEQHITLTEKYIPLVTNNHIKKIGVFFHIFYTELTDEMLDCVDNIPSDLFIHVSTDTKEKQEKLYTIFDRRGYQDQTEIKVFPNKGWDIAPFLVGYGKAIERYPLILRMHSKRSLHIPGDTGEQWRKMLYAALAGSRERVNAILDQFDRSPGLGMICPPLVPHYAHCVNFGGNFARMRALLLQRGVLITPELSIDFPMGSMFWCRPQVLSTWIHPKFCFDDFVPSADLDVERDGTLAHALERLFFFGCGLSGMSWARIPALSTQTSFHQ